MGALVSRSSLSFLALALGMLVCGAAPAQSAGGFSAGPGLEAAQQHETLVTQPASGEATPSVDAGVPAAEGKTEAAASESDKGSDYETNVTTFKPSPKYTQVREFTTTRLWVIDPGQVTVEQWWNGGFGAPRAQPGPNQGSQFFQSEIELGIYKHLQLDLYANYQFGQMSDGTYHIAPGGHTGIAAELRIALGSYWGQYWGNPTLYFELTSQYYNSPRAEVRLLLGGTVFTSKLLAALNLCFERNIFRDSSSGIDYEIKAAYGLNYEIVPDIFRIGVEGVIGFDSHGILDPNAPGGVALGGQEIFPVAEIGPSIVLMEPHRRIKVLAAMLFGLAQYDQPWQPTVIVSSAF